MTTSTWLHRLGLSFNPFQWLEASQDPHLSDYLVGHHAFEVLWGDWNSIVFAPVGGGKTALRVRTAQSCWLGQETNRPFPLVYLPPYLQVGQVHLSLTDHLEALLRTTVKQLFFVLAYRPHWFLRLNKAAQKEIGHFFQELETVGFFDYRRYLTRLQDSRDIASLKRALRLDASFALADPPEITEIRQFCHQLNSISLKSVSDLTLLERWQKMVAIILHTLNFKAIYLLVDGLDNTAETSAAPTIALTSLQPLLAQIEDWSPQKIYFKCFFPLSLVDIVTLQSFMNHYSISRTTVHWTPPALVEIIQARLLCASGGDYDSLSAIASPELPHLDLQLAELVKPLPRELLVVTQQLLARLEHDIPSRQLINVCDIDFIENWYQNNSNYLTEGGYHHVYDHS